MITVLTGGTGGAKFVDGLSRLLPAEELTIIVNTADDYRWWGLQVSPDLDSITYMLAGILSSARGWGVEGDTFHCLQTMQKLEQPAWFSVGDRDLATHLVRTRLLAEGHRLSQATEIIAGKLGIGARILPMTDDSVETRIKTAEGELGFQEYFVRRSCRDQVHGVRFVGDSRSRPAPGALEAITAAEAVLLAPSNPVTSIGPILSVPGFSDALARTSAPVVAVSPIIGRTAVSGPAANLMAAQGLEPSIVGVVDAYRGFLDMLLVHESDAHAGRKLEREGLEVHAADILMRTNQDRLRVARSALALARRNVVSTAEVE
ncbi:MAG: 2-phospho-L-lactate transferase [Acidobacteria bacterium]|nr:2-phospho-L-lactate transferase [Acidobacteriota bacterium]MBV9625713.1 2-phospho-L-lactate transferase [Acidobacteriota bacterium]